MKHKRLKTWNLLIIAALLFSVLLTPLASQGETAGGSQEAVKNPSLSQLADASADEAEPSAEPGDSGEPGGDDAGGSQTVQEYRIPLVDPKLLATLPSTGGWAESWWIAALAAVILMAGVITTLLILRSGGAGAAKLYIEGRNPTFAGKQFPLNQALVFGRDKDKCQVVFPSNAEGISHIHCKVELRNHRAFLSDAHSTYGTYVNDRKLGAGEVYELRAGDVFSLAAAQKNSFSLIIKEM